MEAKDWYVVDAGKKLKGPFTTSEARLLLESLEKNSFLIRNGAEPIYAHDVIGFEEIASLGRLIENPEIVASVLPNPASKARGNVSDEFIAVATTDFTNSDAATGTSLTSAQYNAAGLGEWVRKLFKSKKNDTGNCP